MKRVMAVVLCICFLLVVAGGTGTVEAQQSTSIPLDQLGFTSDRTNGIPGISITRYYGAGGAIVIQREINRIPIRSIGDKAFSGEKIFSVIIPDSVVIIGESAFSGNLLTSVTIPNSVTSIGDFAFNGNLLTSITIGANVSFPARFWDNLSIFKRIYKDGGSLAGTYTRPDVNSDVWTKR